MVTSTLVSERHYLAVAEKTTWQAISPTPSVIVSIRVPGGMRKAAYALWRAYWWFPEGVREKVEPRGEYIWEGRTEFITYSSLLSTMALIPEISMCAGSTPCNMGQVDFLDREIIQVFTLVADCGPFLKNTLGLWVHVQGIKLQWFKPPIPAVGLRLSVFFFHLVLPHPVAHTKSPGYAIFQPTFEVLIMRS